MIFMKHLAKTEATYNCLQINCMFNLKLLATCKNDFFQNFFKNRKKKWIKHNKQRIF